MRALLDDLRYSVRLLRKAPGPIAIAVASLAVAIGANTAVFSFVNALQFRPLPFADEASLVDVSETSRTELCAGCGVGTTWPTFVEWRQAARSFQALEGFREERAVVAGGSGPERVSSARVTAGLFGTLGVAPPLGRDFHPDDEAPAAQRVVVVGDTLWRRRLGADPGVLGRPLRIDGVDHTIVGVMPSGFRFPEFAELWIPVGRAGMDWDRTDRSLSVIGRLGPGIPIERARAEMATIGAATALRLPTTNGAWSVQVMPIRDDLTGETAQASLVLLGAVGCVLIIACANVASLLLVRTAERRRELAIRSALGATPGRVIRLVLVESLLLATAGGMFGSLVSLWASAAIMSAFEMDVPYWIRFGTDWRVVAFGGCATLATAVLCGIAPVVQACRPDLQRALSSGGGVVGDRKGRRVQAALVAGQLALALPLLAGAGLLIRTVVRTWQFTTPYDPRLVLAGDLALSSPKYEAPSQIDALATAVIERIERQPGVRAAVSRTIFFAGFGAEPRRMIVEGMPNVPAGGTPPFYFAVTGHYFDVSGLTIRSGRPFTPQERSGAVIVNETLASRVWPGGQAIGRRIRLGEDGTPGEWLTVVGVVSDEPGGPLSRTRRASAYVPLASAAGRQVAIHVRTPFDARSAAAEIRAAVAAVDPDQPVEDLMTMEQALARSVAPARFVSQLMGGLGGVALLLASLGTFAVTARSVQVRGREMAVRIALGATPRQIHALVTRSALRLAAWGLMLGVPAALASTRLLRGVLFGTSPTDAGVFACVTALLAAVVLAAGWLPARRAARIDPMRVLRAE